MGGRGMGRRRSGGGRSRLVRGGGRGCMACGLRNE